MRLLKELSKLNELVSKTRNKTEVDKLKATDHLHLEDVALGDAGRDELLQHGLLVEPERTGQIGATLKWDKNNYCFNTLHLDTYYTTCNYFGP